MSEFTDNIKRIHGKRNFKITNSYGCRDYYKYFKRKRKSNIPEALFHKILEEAIDQIFEQYLALYLRVKLPSKMGELFIKQFEFEIEQRANGVYFKRTPVDWGKTICLWEVDPEAYAQRAVVKHELPYYHTLLYKTSYRDFRNHQVFQMKFCRKLHKKIHQRLTLHKFF